MSKRRIIESLRRSIPSARQAVIPWATENVVFRGSARSMRFDAEKAPWLIEVIEAATNGMNSSVTFVKPVQTGGSVVGEVVLLYWLKFIARGGVQYNWEDDGKARQRWLKRFFPALEDCRPVFRMWPREREKSGIGLVIFPHCSLTMQGVEADANIDSDSIHLQVNEEIHNWAPGKLATAKVRTTAYWDALQLNISNAGKEGDQLHQEFLAGTQQYWTVKCPGCTGYHMMQFFWKQDRPDLGGLRWDSKKAKRDDRSYDYNLIESTIYYQMPCGYKLRNDPNERRRLSLTGRYSEPKNQSARLSKRSYTLDCVSVDYIDWVGIVEEYHQALRARKGGDEKPFHKWLTRRPCIPFSVDHLPDHREVITTRGKRLSIDGMPNRKLRFAAGDYQEGDKNELPYWWLVIRDMDEKGNSLLVFEGKIEHEGPRIPGDDHPEDRLFSAKINEYKVNPWHVVCDSGHDTKHVYQFCYENGYNAIKGGKYEIYKHADGSENVYEMWRPLCTMLEVPTKYQRGDYREPGYWHYSKHGVRELYHSLHKSQLARWEVPENVSDIYKAHQQAEERTIIRNTRTNEAQIVWKQLKDRNDLFVCECYIAMLMDMAGYVGAKLVAKLKAPSPVKI